VLMINTLAPPGTQSPPGVTENKTAEASLRRLETANSELTAILDTATDGVVILDRAGRVLSANRSAQALFGYDAHDIAELSLGDLFAPESRRPLLDHLDRLARNGGPESFDPGREAIGLERRGGLVPLYITMGRINDGEKFCAVLRDITAWKRSEEELINAKQDAEKASIAKSEFLAKISHEIRTPLNAIIGFSELMMDERLGPVGNERYRQYLKDIHASGGHLISLLNDLLDLSKIEAGKLELTFVSVNLNDLVQQCVAMLQEQANRERVIIRTSLPAGLPQIVADARSVRQIALNVLSNSIKFTGAGGQVIVSTALTDDQEVVLRVRDTGHGMSEKELQTALEPFRQLATSPRWGASGTGLGLPITKALAEANHARFHITSRVQDGTLVEVAFPATRVLAQ
jgi:PAS domain S-box-containing protein